MPYLTPNQARALAEQPLDEVRAALRALADQDQALPYAIPGDADWPTPDYVVTIHTEDGRTVDVCRFAEGVTDVTGMAVVFSDTTGEPVGLGPVSIPRSTVTLVEVN